MQHAIRSFVIRISSFVILNAPLCVFGHGAEFLSAKLTLLPDAEVLLEITADHGGNPLIVDESAAKDALLDPIRLRRDDVLVPLAQIATASPRRLFHHRLVSAINGANVDAPPRKPNSALAMPKVQMLPDEPAQTNPPHTAAAPISSTGMMPCRSASRPVHRPPRPSPIIIAV